MSLGFVLTKEQGTSGIIMTERCLTVQELAGTPAELEPRLRSWAREYVQHNQCDDGRYFAYLVELDDDGGFDTYFALATEDLVWFYEQEYVPAS